MKKIISAILAIIVVFMMVVPAMAAESEYLPKYNGTSASLVDALKSIPFDSSYQARSELAKANGVVNYEGKPEENTFLLSLLREGKLLRPGAQESSEVTSTNNRYFPKCASHYESIVEALTSIGAKASYGYRQRIGQVNGMLTYSGSAEENMTMLRKLKDGTLVNPDPEIDNAPVNPVTTFGTIEIYGHRGEVFVCAKEAPIRDQPSKSGQVIYETEKNEPLQAISMVQNRAGNRWIQVFVPGSNKIGYVFIGNLAEKKHQHEYISLDEYGYPGFSYCSACATLVRSEPVEITMDMIHLGLAILSLEQTVGNAFDLADACLSIIEGDMVAASLGFAAAFPGLGGAIDKLQVGKAVSEVVETTIRHIDVGAALTKIGDNIVEVTSRASSHVLAKNMQEAFLKTGDFRFYRWTQHFDVSRTWAAHHIVPGGAKGAEEARNILKNVKIDINSADNGVFLCSKSSVCNGTIHAGGHSKEYYEAVNEALRKAYESCNDMQSKRDAVIAALNDIATRLRKGEMDL